MAFGHELWSVQDCIEKFKNLVETAFTPWGGQNLPVVDIIERIHKGSKYQTEPLETALQSAFGTDGNLFGSQRKDNQRRVKVAVTTTSHTGDRSQLLSNYNIGNDATVKAPDAKDMDYLRDRPERLSEELKVWQA